MRRDAAVQLVTIICSILFLAIGNRLVSGGPAIFGGEEGQRLREARIERILDEYVAEADVDSAEPEETLRITFEAALRDGGEAGRRVVAVQVADSFTPAEIRHAREGDRVLLYEIEEAEEGSPDRWVLQEFVRTGPLLGLVALFAVALLLFGRSKGFFTLVSLAFTCLAVFCIFIPSVLSGANLYLSSAVVCGFIVAMTLLLVNGANRKSFAAGVGCMAGVATSGALVLVSNLFLRLTGLVDEQSVFLLYLNPDAPIDLKAVIFSSIVIGSLGATLDVSVSIASALAEVRDAMARAGFSSLFRSGMNIGRDIMGTMANTLVLAYIGSSLSLVLLLLVNSSSLTDLLNREVIVVEGLQILVGSIGLLCTIPLTSFLAAYVYMAREEAENNED